MTIGMPQCILCRHFDKHSPSCTAYPDGVPRSILENQHDHRRALAGDHGVQFEAKDDESRNMMVELMGPSPGSE
jgi:hypothetical protein